MLPTTCPTAVRQPAWRGFLDAHEEQFTAGPHPAVPDGVPGNRHPGLLPEHHRRDGHPGAGGRDRHAEEPGRDPLRRSGYSPWWRVCCWPGRH